MEMFLHFREGLLPDQHYVNIFAEKSPTKVLQAKDYRTANHFYAPYALVQGLANWPWATSNLPLILVNTVLLEYSYAHLFMYCLWLFWGCSGRVE